MQGVGTYRPLDNPTYMQMFQFCPPKFNKRKGMVKKNCYAPVQT